MELGQMMWGNPTGEYECPEYVEALVKYLINELELHWDRQHTHTPGCDDPRSEVICQWEDVYEFKVGGIEYRKYYWGDDEEEAAKPNLSFKGVEVRWYKYPGRGQTVNMGLEAHEWARWFDDFIYEIGNYDEDTLRYRERLAKARAEENGEDNRPD